MVSVHVSLRYIYKSELTADTSGTGTKRPSILQRVEQKE